MSRKALRRVVYVVGAIILVLMVVAAGLYIWAPGYAASVLVPQLAREIGLDDVSLDVRRIGSAGLDLGPVEIGEADAPALRVASTQVDYIPSGLWGRKIERVVVNGLEIYLVLEDGKVVPRGIDLQKVLDRLKGEEKRSGKEEESSGSGKRFEVERVEIRNSVLVLIAGEDTFRVPFDSGIRFQENGRKLKTDLTVYPRGEKIFLSGAADLVDKKAEVSLDGDIALGQFGDLTRSIPELTLLGKLSLQGEGRFGWSPFSVEGAGLDLRLKEPVVSYGEIELVPQEKKGQKIKRTQRTKGTHGQDGEKDSGMGLSISVEDQEVRFSFSPFLVDGPVPVEVRGWDGQMDLSKEELNIKGGMTAALQKIENIEFPEPLEFVFQYGAGYGDKGWRFQVDAGTTEKTGNPVRMIFGAGEFAVKNPAAEISGSGGSGGMEISFRLNAGDLDLTAGPARIRVPEMDVSGSFQEKGPVRSELKFSKGSVSLPQAGFSMAGIRGALPFHWPIGKDKASGEVWVDAIRWEEKFLGAAEIDVEQGAEGFSFRGAHYNRLIKGLVLKVQGDFPLFAASDGLGEIDLQLLRPERSGSMDLRSLFPAASGIIVDGLINGEGHFRFHDRGITGAFEGDLSKGTVHKEGAFSVEGIEMGFSLPELPYFRTAPEQKLRFQRAAFGDIFITDGSVNYQIEPGGVFFLEEARFGWSGGLISVQATRIVPGVQDFSAVLYGDRINLAKILEQVGVARAEGEGAVSGKIPIQYKNGSFFFDNAFLFSTPGEGGTIHVTGAEMLTAALSDSLREATQIELAQEALKDYEYQWATLRLDTLGEDMLLQLRFDGKPTHPLPFHYNRDMNRFIRVDAGAEGSVFQGIRLDVNFRLPLNQLLKYKDFFQMIQ